MCGVLGDADPGLVSVHDPEISADFRLVIHEDVRRTARVRAVIGWLHAQREAVGLEL